jgi:purine-nucleoside phosphorylase
MIYLRKGSDKMATPHIDAKIEEVAETVIMPGDPLRAKMIAEKYLTDVIQFNDVRNMFGYTGYYKGKRISVMGSGMGMPSMGIYSYELFSFFNVKKIIRVGSCGTLVPHINLYDLILVDKACSDTSYDEAFLDKDIEILESNEEISEQIYQTAINNQIKINRGNIYTTDALYGDTPNNELVKKYNCLAAEMEAYALFLNAKKTNNQAACVLTVSDSLLTKEKTTSEEREKNFTEMIELVLEALL